MIGMVFGMRTSPLILALFDILQSDSRFHLGCRNCSGYKVCGFGWFGSGFVWFSFTPCGLAGDYEMFV